MLSRGEHRENYRQWEPERGTSKGLTAIIALKVFTSGGNAPLFMCNSSTRLARPSVCQVVTTMGD